MGGRGSVGALAAPGPGDKVESGQVPRPPLASGCASPGSHPSFLRSLPDLKVIGPHHCAWDPWRESGATGVSPGDKGAIVPGGRRALWGGSEASRTSGGRGEIRTPVWVPGAVLRHAASGSRCRRTQTAPLRRTFTAWLNQKASNLSWPACLRLFIYLFVFWRVKEREREGERDKERERERQTKRQWKE